MSALTIVECDLCGLGARGPIGTDADELRRLEGLEPGAVHGLPDLPDVHPSCAAEHLRSGVPGRFLAGLPGMAS